MANSQHAPGRAESFTADPGAQAESGHLGQPTLYEFLTRLVSDPAARSAFDADPHGALAQAGLGDMSATDVLQATSLVLDYAPVEVVTEYDRSLQSSVEKFAASTQHVAINQLHPAHPHEQEEQTMLHKTPEQNADFGKGGDVDQHIGKSAPEHNKVDIDIDQRDSHNLVNLHDVASHNNIGNVVGNTVGNVGDTVSNTVGHVTNTVNHAVDTGAGFGAGAGNVLHGDVTNVVNNVTTGDITNVAHNAPVVGDVTNAVGNVGNVGDAVHNIAGNAPVVGNVADTVQNVAGHAPVVGDIAGAAGHADAGALPTDAVTGAVDNVTNALPDAHNLPVVGEAADALPVHDVTSALPVGDVASHLPAPSDLPVVGPVAGGAVEHVAGNVASHLPVDHIL